ncbi:PREDICTED: zinc finger BED domain-containing protein DAYSLEEPER-like [Nelumbo nucifera]|uniref:Zinc finger BED domain-containing protein DAYSLEEPER-like n=1 Tax=Nelumbo nucifera TaxID=4432 RepID=A0A1U8A6Y5_NELNU|nr:PREDICTED: zinc finger BED domain-containing protein DAYSLEEPER-like [Nelumbo nucifera]
MEPEGNNASSYSINWMAEHGSFENSISFKSPPSPTAEDADAGDTNNIAFEVDPKRKKPYESESDSDVFDQEACQKALARMIIINGLPFSFVEREGFKGFVRSIQPRFQLVSRATIAMDCMKLYISERKKLKEDIKSSSRICLSSNLWTSAQNLEFVCLTAHYIDNVGIYKEKLLIFVQFQLQIVERPLHA